MPSTNKKKEQFVDVVVDLPVEGEFTYAVPAGLAREAELGKRVLVPFGKRKVTGYIVLVKNKSDFKRVKPIIEVLDLAPLFDEKRLKFFRTMLVLMFLMLKRAL